MLTYRTLRGSDTVGRVMGSRVGERIRAFRKDKSWSQEKLADAAGMRRTHVTAIETGAIQTPDSDTLRKLADALGVSILSLLQDDLPAERTFEVRGIVPTSPITPERDFTRSGERHPLPADLPFRVIDFRAGLVEAALRAEVACGEPMDYSVDGEGVLVPRDYAPDETQGEFLVRARGDSMTSYGIQDGWYVVVERRKGGVAASGELILAWYEPADKASPGGITLKHWIRKGGRKILQGSTPETTYELKDGDVFELQGIVRRAWPPPLVFPKISG